jgi:hypothetical protein
MALFFSHVLDTNTSFALLAAGTMTKGSTPVFLSHPSHAHFVHCMAHAGNFTLFPGQDIVPAAAIPILDLVPLP